MANCDAMKLEILMSCMDQKDFSLAQQSNVHSDIIMVNQCDKKEELSEIINGNRRRMICSVEKGLSRSRNLALKHAKGDILLLADDDEVFVDNLEEIVLDAFRVTGADIIAFDLYEYPKSLRRKIRRLHLLETSKISSCQIAFKRESIEKVGLKFDINLGAGTPNGGGEENKFLWDAYKAGASIFYVPAYIAHLREKKSAWFHGFSKDYFYKRGKVTRYYMGRKWALIYAIYFVLAKYQIYKQECTWKEAISSMIGGIYSEKDFGDS